MACATRRHVWYGLLCALYALNGLGGARWGRLRAIYHNILGMPELEVGIVSASIPVVRFCFSPLWGLVADYCRNKKGVSLLTRCASTVFLLLLALPWIRRVGFYAVLAVCIAMSAFVAPGVINAHTLDFLGPENVRGFGRIRVWLAITWGLGSFVMGEITDRYGFEWNFILFGVLQAGAVVLTAFIIPGPCCCSPRPRRSTAERGGSDSRCAFATNTGGGEEAAVRVSDDWDPYAVAPDPSALLEAGRDAEGSGAAQSPAGAPPTPRSRWGRLGAAFEVMFFFLEMLIMGAAAAVVERLLFLYLINDLGASTALCGLSVLVTVIFEVPLFCFSDVLLKRVGHDALFLVSMVAYCIRVYGYCLITPETRYWILALESLHGITFACLWVAAVERARTLAPEWGGTIQSILDAVYRCLGCAIGSVVGGWAMERYGAVAMYRCTSYIVAALFAAHLSCVIFKAVLALCAADGASRGAARAKHDGGLSGALLLAKEERGGQAAPKGQR